MPPGPGKPFEKGHKLAKGGRRTFTELYNSVMATKKKGGGIVRTIVMEDDLWTPLRLRAVEEKTSASEIIRRLVAEYLKKPKKGGKRE